MATQAQAGVPQHPGAHAAASPAAAAASGSIGAKAAAAVEAEAECAVLEDFKKCSESLLWKLMMSFYDKKGVESWSQGIVPHFITCNAFIGRAYAKVLHGFLCDSMRGGPTKIDPAEPLYIIELGAGSGKFGFFMLQALMELKATSPFPLENIVYVMTDFTKQNFDFWTEHEGLKGFVESGQLDFAIFDAVADGEITLHRSGKVLKPKSMANPLCIVANYLFDTLYHDIFQVSKDGALTEGLISVGSKRSEEPDILDPDIIKRLHNRFQYNPIESSYYAGTEEEDVPHFERVFEWYKSYFAGSTSGASILVPIGAMRALRRLLRFSNGRGIVISGDKGHNNPDQFRGQSDPHIAVHGSFSVMVNYHAIGMLFTSRGGFALHNPQEEASLKVSCFVATGGTEAVDDGRGWTGDMVQVRDDEGAAAFPHLAEQFNDHVSTFGPNDFFVMQKALKEDAPTPTLKSIVALLKLGSWDPDVFYKFRDILLDQVPTAGPKLRNDICRGIPLMWKRYYMLDKDKDIAFEIGRFYYGIRDYANALKFYGISVSSIGNHHVTSHNMGLCQYSMGRPEEALIFFESALEINAKYEKARQWGNRVRKELARAKGIEAEAQGEAPKTAVATLGDVHVEVPAGAGGAAVPAPPAPAGGGDAVEGARAPASVPE